MNIYTDINEIPLKNWINLQKSLSKNIDLKQLLKHPTKRQIRRCNSHPKTIKKLLDVYLNLLYKMPHIDTELNKTYLELKLKLIDYNIKIEKNAYRKIINKKEIDIIKYDVEKIFNEYLNLLDKNYTDFEYHFFYVKEDFDKEWKRIFKDPAPEEFSKQMQKSGIGFFLWEEYFHLINKWNLDLRIKMSTKRFYELFIKSKKIKAPSLIEINERIKKDFKENKEYNKYFALRFDFFDMKKLKFRAKKEHSILDDVIKTNKILSQNIDLKQISVGWFLKEYSNNLKEQNGRSSI